MQLSYGWSDPALMLYDLFFRHLFQLAPTRLGRKKKYGIDEDIKVSNLLPACLVKGNTTEIASTPFVHDQIGFSINLPLHEKRFEFLWSVDQGVYDAVHVAHHESHDLTKMRLTLPLRCEITPYCWDPCRRKNGIGAADHSGHETIQSGNIQYSFVTVLCDFILRDPVQKQLIKDIQFLVSQR